MAQHQGNASEEIQSLFRFLFVPRQESRKLDITKGAGHYIQKRRKSTNDGFLNFIRQEIDFTRLVLSDIVMTAVQRLGTAIPIEGMKSTYM